MHPEIKTNIFNIISDTLFLKEDNFYRGTIQKLFVTYVDQHIPVITNKKCRFSYKEGIYYYSDSIFNATKVTTQCNFINVDFNNAVELLESLENYNEMLERKDVINNFIINLCNTVNTADELLACWPRAINLNLRTHFKYTPEPVEFSKEITEFMVKSEDSFTLINNQYLKNSIL